MECTLITQVCCSGVCPNPVHAIVCVSRIAMASLVDRQIVGSTATRRSSRGLVVRVLDSGLYGRGFDPHTGHGSLLKLRQFHLPLITVLILIFNLFLFL